MSVTIHTNPQSYTPSDNPVTWKFSSDQTGQPNFSYLVEVYVNAVLHSRHQIFPERGIYAHFDAKDIASISTSPPVMSTSLYQDASNNAQMYIKVIERYGTTVTSHADATSSTVTVFKGCLSDQDFVDYDSTDYIYAATKKWLTLFPRTEQYLCGMTESMWMLFVTDTTATLFNVALYDENDTPIASDSISISPSARITAFNISPAIIISATAITAGDFTTCAYYEVFIDDGAINFSERFRVYVDRECDKYGTQRLQFLSSIGSVESFSFTKANTNKRDVTRFGHEKQFGEWDASDNFVYDTATGREVDHIAMSNGKMTISSDWMSQGVQNWLSRELYESPLVFLGTDLKRVKVLNSSYNYKQEITDMLFQEVVEIGLDKRVSARV